MLRAAFASSGGGSPVAAHGGRASAPAGTAWRRDAAGHGADRRPRPARRTGGFIQADPSTNSLIITAAEPLYRQVRSMIDQLDSRRAQVYIESMIVEVDGDNAADFGFQWQGLIGNRGDKHRRRRAAPTSAPARATSSTVADSRRRRRRHGWRSAKA